MATAFAAVDPTSFVFGVCFLGLGWTVAKTGIPRALGRFMGSRSILALKKEVLRIRWNTMTHRYSQLGARVAIRLLARNIF
jgi:hypothetical protein